MRQENIPSEFRGIPDREILKTEYPKPFAGFCSDQLAWLSETNISDKINYRMDRRTI